MSYWPRHIGTTVVVSAALFGCGDSDNTPDSSVSIDAASDTGETPTPLDSSNDAAWDADTPSRRYFEDITLTAGLSAIRELRDDYTTLPDRMGGGVCVVDVDDTPPLDLFFAMRDVGQGSRLFVGRGPLAYSDETEARGLADVGDALGCLAVDVDGDRDQDLLVTTLGSVRLFENREGAFTDVSDRITASFPPVRCTCPRRPVMSTVTVISISWWLEINASNPSLAPADCTPTPCSADVRAHVPIPNLLLVRGADGTYLDRASTLAPLLAEPEPTLVVGIADLDADGRPSVYVGNDLGSFFVDRVLSADGPGPMRDVGDALGLAYNARGYGIDSMGWTTGDVDGNGVFDHVVTSFEGDPTALFMCHASAPCQDESARRGVDERAYTFRWGAALFDIDLDGDLDLFEATGHLFSDQEVRDFGFALGQHQRPNLFVNDGEGVFASVEPRADDGLARPTAARGVAVVDLDDDGRLDVVLASAVGRPVLLHNVAERSGRHLRVVLVGRSPNSGAVGARVEVVAGTRAIVRERIVGEGYLGNFDPRLHFGIPRGVERVSVRVRWPDGATSVRSSVPVDSELVISRE